MSILDAPHQSAMVSFSSSSQSQSSAQSGPAVLGRAFADYLEATHLYPGLKVVDCAMEAGRLTLQMQHRSPEAKDPNALLKELEIVFRELMPAVGSPDGDWIRGEDLPVRISLRLVRSDRPYATYTFTWRIEDAAMAVFPELVEASKHTSQGTSQRSENEAAAAEGADADDPANAIATDPAATQPLTMSLTPSDGASQGLPPGEDQNPPGPGLPEPPPGESDALPLVTFSDAAIALPDTQVQTPPNPGWRFRPWQTGVQGLRYMAPYWGYLISGAILVASGVFAYGVTRPCVVGGCDRIERAANLQVSAQEKLQTTPDADTLEQAESDLQAAVAILTPIPRWSPHYQAVQSDIAQYQAEIQTLDSLQQAQTLATRAANLSQDPPHPVEHWVDTHRLWLQAIERLASIPIDSPVYDYSQEKLKEYEANATAIDRRVIAEEAAEANLNTAIQTGQLAQQRMETAETLAGWQLAAKEWQTAVHGLSLIPQGTMAYDDAQNYLQDYRRQLLTAQNQATQEKLTSQFYQQAVQAAKEAEAYQAKNQWTLAVRQWQQAVRFATRIPVNTELAADREALVESYQASLTNAQTRLRGAVALQALTQTVGTLCGNSGTSCTVSEDDSQIKITLANQFAEPLRQAITPPTTDGQFTFANQLTPDIQQLIEQVITMSHRANRQVAVYDASGSFVARYRPDLGGFSKN
jgi:hypothetical protein